MQTALYGLALRWGRARGAHPEAGRTALDQVAALALDAFDMAEHPARAVAARLVGRSWASFIGAGPSEASARFGAAKLIEGARILGVGTNLEERAHEEHFGAGKSTPVVVIAPTGAATDRANELVSELGC